MNAVAGEAQRVRASCPGRSREECHVQIVAVDQLGCHSQAASTNEPLLAEERRLLLSVEDFANYEAPQEGRYQKLVTCATRTIDLNIESRSSDRPRFLQRCLSIRTLMR